MKDKKELTGRFHRLFRVGTGDFGIETVIVENGKIVKVEEVEANYPTITMSMFGKRALQEAMVAYDLTTQVKA